MKGQDLASSEDFAEARLRDGKLAYGARRPADAVGPLRIAAFGLLDRPALLCESLIYLALAQETSEHPDDARATVQRLLSIQARIYECSTARLDPAIRAEFVSRFHQGLPAPPAPPPRAPTPRSGSPGR
jgi:hypothetical protein